MFAKFFFGVKKNVKCRCIDRKKKISVFVREEKKSKCPKKNFQSVERGVKEEKKIISVEFRVFEKKGIGRRILEGKKSKCFLGEKKVKVFVAVKES